MDTMANKIGAIPVFSELRAFGETDRQEITNHRDKWYGWECRCCGSMWHGA